MAINSETLISNDYLNEDENRRYYKMLHNIVKNTNKKEVQKYLNSIKPKLNDYIDIKTLKISLEELKCLLPNLTIDPTCCEFLWFIGIEKLEEETYGVHIHKFLKGLIVTMLNEIGFNEKVDLIFSMYDRDKDNIILRSDLEFLLKHYNESSSLNLNNQTMNGIIDVLMMKLDKNRKNKISKEAFKEFLLEHKNCPLTLNPFIKEINYSMILSRERNTLNNIEINKTSNKQEESEESVEPPKLGGWYIFLRLHFKNIIWFLAYLSLSFYIIYDNIDMENMLSHKPYAHMGSCLCLMNLSILLSMMCENFWTLIRGTFLFHFLPIDDIKFNHELTASVYVITGCIHGLLNCTFGWIKHPFDFINYIQNFTSRLGWTGSVMILIFTIMAITSIRCIRRLNYEIFWYLHKLYLVSMVLLYLHHNNKKFWKWAYWPLIIIAIEYFIKFGRFFILKTKIISIKVLDGNVIELIINKPLNFSFISGQFVRVQIPEICFLQWHPFTIASCPSQPEIVFYISPVGWWTKKLEKIGNKFNQYNPVRLSFLEKTANFKRRGTDQTNNSDNQEIQLMLKKAMKNIDCRIDGPLGAPAQNYNKHKNLMLIAQGIGATPFASILYNMINLIKIDIVHVEVDFYWVIRDKKSTQWLVKLFKDILENDTNNILRFNLIITAPQQKYDIRSFFLWKGLDLLKKEKPLLVTSFYGNIFWGRPDWKKMFMAKRNALSNLKGNVGVFVCGKDSFSSDILKACKETSGDGISFDFHKEHF